MPKSTKFAGGESRKTMLPLGKECTKQRTVHIQITQHSSYNKYSQTQSIEQITYMLCTGNCFLEKIDKK